MPICKLCDKQAIARMGIDSMTGGQAEIDVCAFCFEAVCNGAVI